MFHSALAFLAFNYYTTMPNFHSRTLTKYENRYFLFEITQRLKRSYRGDFGDCDCACQWLEKQAEARRIIELDDKDLTEEEKNPVWLRDKGK